MKMSRLGWSLIAATCCVLPNFTCGQGTFQNLDFESPVFVPVGGDPFIVEAGPALAGWIPYIGTNQIDAILHNTVYLSFATVAIYGPDNPTPELLQGQYYLRLQNSFPIPTDRPSVAQTGTIPITAASVQFLSNQSYGGIGMSFSGQGIGLWLIQDLGNNRYLWGGNISAFAGQTGTLRFLGEGYLDYIQFSDQPIPEPSVFGLVAVGALVLGWPLRGMQKRCARRE